MMNDISTCTYPPPLHPCSTSPQATTFRDACSAGGTSPSEARLVLASRKIVLVDFRGCAPKAIGDRTHTSSAHSVNEFSGASRLYVLVTGSGRDCFAGSLRRAGVYGRDAIFGSYRPSLILYSITSGRNPAIALPYSVPKLKSSHFIDGIIARTVLSCYNYCYISQYPKEYQGLMLVSLRIPYLLASFS